LLARSKFQVRTRCEATTRWKAGNSRPISFSVPAGGATCPRIGKPRHPRDQIPPAGRFFICTTYEIGTARVRLVCASRMYRFTEDGCLPAPASWTRGLHLTPLTMTSPFHKTSPNSVQLPCNEREWQGRQVARAGHCVCL